MSKDKLKEKFTKESYKVIDSHSKSDFIVGTRIVSSTTDYLEVNVGEDIC